MLYDSSYDQIANVARQKLQEHAPQILEDAKRNLDLIKKLKKKHILVVQ